MLIMRENTFKVCGTSIYKICRESNIQWCVAHMGKQMAKVLFLKTGFLLTKYGIGTVWLES